MDILSKIEPDWRWKTEGIQLMLSPRIPIIAGWCDWFQPSAAWAHLDNKMAYSLGTHTYRCKYRICTHAQTNGLMQTGGKTIFSDTENQPNRNRPASYELQGFMAIDAVGEERH